MRTTLLLLCGLLLAEQVLSFGYTNYQLPQKTTRYQRLLHQRANGRCANRLSCESLDRVDPIWKFRPTYVQTFQPSQDYVLVAYIQDDTEGSTDRQQRANQEWDKFTGIVVAKGPNVTASSQKLLTEGSRVYFARACIGKWGDASNNWASTYPPFKQTAMRGRLVNGVDLNNAWGWGYTRAPETVTFNTATNYGLDSTTSESATSTPAFGDNQWYPGRAGQGQWDRTADGGFRDDMPADNPWQQANYLLCKESQIHGKVTQENFENQVASHYRKSSSAFETSKDLRPYQTTEQWKQHATDYQRGV
eukprot:NODE_996_length_1102_cov_1204.440646_g692_i0.p1 GENE.NODE_996_length_1102_cov_1204.440646_g692_i0~~NODE_996_length_1102_cov_1204.440646_g692_i0.p1  ORF type:complete len:326 (+),score=149.16 NODE_996_length_1102_cov_1204.440646_g692_i0:64-978(+)